MEVRIIKPLEAFERKARVINFRNNCKFKWTSIKKNSYANAGPF